MKIKVCGLAQIPQILELKAMNIDFLGFIFYGKSPRFVLNHLTLKQIGEIPHTGKVGVFVNESIRGVSEIATEAQLDFVQLHGDEDVEYFKRLKNILGGSIKIIKAIRMGNKSIAELQKTIDELNTSVDYFLFDTDSKAFGGTGRTFDWQILNQLKIPKSYFLSGGISLENISQLPDINNQPFALDINSKFESEAGIKDLEKIRTFKSLLK